MAEQPKFCPICGVKPDQVNWKESKNDFQWGEEKS